MPREEFERNGTVIDGIARDLKAIRSKAKEMENWMKEAERSFTAQSARNYYTIVQTLANSIEARADRIAADCQRLKSALPAETEDF